MEILDTLARALYTIAGISIVLAVIFVPTIIKWVFRIWFIQKTIQLLKKKKKKYYKTKENTMNHAYLDCLAIFVLAMGIATAATIYLDQGEPAAYYNKNE